MKALLQTRLLFWKKEWKVLIFWLLFPLVMTSMVMNIVQSFQEETKVPVGIVLEDDSMLAEQLYESIKETSYIRPVLLREQEALNQLEKQELDSVFIVKSKYEHNVEKSRQHNLITGYHSNFSFAYVPVKELVISYVYEDFTRSRATFVVKDLYEEFNYKGTWDFHQLIEESKQIEDEQDLLQTVLSFTDDVSVRDDAIRVVDPWKIWVIMTLLATLLLFDWIIKENRDSLRQRLPFSPFSMKGYLVINGLFYTGLLLVVDFLSLFMLAILYSVSLSSSILLTVISYRLTLNIVVLLLSQLFKAVYQYYVFAFLLFCFSAIGSGALIPLDGLVSRFPVYTYLNPLEAVLSVTIANHWSLIVLLTFVIWLMRKETHDA